MIIGNQAGHLLDLDQMFISELNRGHVRHIQQFVAIHDIQVNDQIRQQLLGVAGHAVIFAIIMEVHRVFEHEGAETAGGKRESVDSAFSIRNIGIDGIDGGVSFFIRMEMVQLIADAINTNFQFRIPVLLQHIHVNRNRQLVFLGGNSTVGQIDFISHGAFGLLTV